MAEREPYLVAHIPLERLDQLERIEAAARAWVEARKEDARLSKRSIIPTAQALLDALDGK